MLPLFFGLPPEKERREGGSRCAGYTGANRYGQLLGMGDAGQAVKMARKLAGLSAEDYGRVILLAASHGMAPD